MPHFFIYFQKIEPFNTGVRVICKDLTLEADLVLVASGVRPCSELMHNIGCWDICVQGLFP